MTPAERNAVLKEAVDEIDRYALLLMTTDVADEDSTGYAITAGVLRKASDIVWQLSSPEVRP